MRHLEYRGFIAGVLSVFCLYALLSCWPALTALISGRPAAPTAPGAPPAAPASGPPAAAAPGGTPAAPAVQSLRLSAEPPSPAAGPAWQKARGDLVLLDKPGGVGLRPPSLCRAALTIHHGAHVRVLGEQDGWVKVQSASRSVGWVRAAEMRAD